MLAIRCMKWFSGNFGFLLVRELAGVLLLLAVIVCLPVWVSRWFAVDEIPFQEQTALREVIKVRPSKGEIREAMTKTVLGQLEALRSGDYAAAREFASEAFRQHVPVADFERMVKGGFPVMIENHDVLVGGAFNNQDFGFVDVQLVSPRSGAVFYSFVLEATSAGWFVRGVENIDPRGFEGRRPRQQGPRASRGASSLVSKHLG